MPRKTQDERGATSFPFRMRSQLREGLDRATGHSGLSLNAEIHARLERSLAEENAFGGPGMRTLAALTVSAFTIATRMHGSPGSDPFKDRGAYLAGTFAVIDSLFAAIPDATPDEIATQIEGLKGRLLTRLVNAQQDRDAATERRSRKVA
jgi:Arc-like DNA binding domain